MHYFGASGLDGRIIMYKVGSLVSKPVAISERVNLPETVKRSESAALIAALFGTPASAFCAASVTARRDTFVSQCAALALGAMIHGDTSRLERLERYAATLPEYKKGKDGSIGGAIGKLICAYRDACAFGASVRSNPDFDQNADQIDIDHWLGQSPVFGGLVAAPKVQPKAIAKPVAQAGGKGAVVPEPQGLPASVIKALASVELAACEYPHAASSLCGGFDFGNGHALAAMRERTIAIKAANSETPALDIRTALERVERNERLAILSALVAEYGYGLRKLPVHKAG